MEGKISIRYLKQDKEPIRIFGNKFVSTNKEILMMEIEGKKSPLEEFIKETTKMIKIKNI